MFSMLDFMYRSPANTKAGTDFIPNLWVRRQRLRAATQLVGGRAQKIVSSLPHHTRLGFCVPACQIPGFPEEFS